MKRVVAVMLCVQLFLVGCQASSPGGKPNWLQRRVDRFLTLESHNGNPVRNTTNAIFTTTVIVVGVAGVATAYLAASMLDEWIHKEGGKRNFRGPFWEE
jgi:hypothetical protein